MVCAMVGCRLIVIVDVIAPTLEYLGLKEKKGAGVVKIGELYTGFTLKFLCRCYRISWEYLMYIGEFEVSELWGKMVIGVGFIGR